MVASAVALVFLAYYLCRRGYLHLALVAASVIPQYHFRYWLFEATGFSNHGVVYGDLYDARIDDVNDYLDLLLLSFSVIVFAYVRLLGKKLQPAIAAERLKHAKLYAGLILGLFSYAIYFRLYVNQSEESFSTFTLALLMASFAYAVSYAKTSADRLFVIGFGGLTALLIGFKSVILILFVALVLGKPNLRYGNLSLYGVLIVTLMILASMLRGVEASLGSALLTLATSHYDSWSFLVVAFNEKNVDHAHNFVNWLASFATLIPGVGSYFDIQSYGHYLNVRYTSDWFVYTSVLLAPGIIGELWSLGAWVPFAFLPLIVIGFDVAFRVLARSGMPMHAIMLTASIFLLEAPLSNLGQLVKVIVVAVVLGKLLGHVRLRRRAAGVAGPPLLAPSTG